MLILISKHDPVGVRWCQINNIDEATIVDVNDQATPRYNFSALPSAVVKDGVIIRRPIDLRDVEEQEERIPMLDIDNDWRSNRETCKRLIEALGSSEYSRLEAFVPIGEVIVEDTEAWLRAVSIGAKCGVTADRLLSYLRAYHGPAFADWTPPVEASP